MGVILIALLVVGLLLPHLFARRAESVVRAGTPPGKTVDVGGYQIHYIESPGPEPTVVFLHGNPGVAEDFQPVAALLKDKHRVISFDRPGYGFTDRPQLRMSPLDQAKVIHGALAAIGVSKPVLGGFSFGGPVSLAYAIEYPGELRALVLIAAVGSPVEGHRMPAGQAMLARPVLGPLLAWTWGPLLAEGKIRPGYEDAFHPKAPDDVIITRGKLHFTRPLTLQASAQDWKVLEETFGDLGKRFGEIKIPVEALSANQDRIVGDAHAKHLEEQIAGIKLERIEGAGHQLMSTHAYEVSEAVLRAVERSK